MSTTGSKGASRPRRATWAVAALVYLFGVYWRFRSTTGEHDPRTLVYSDMQMYVGLAKRLATPGYVATPLDATHPPATAELIRFFYERDPDLSSLVFFQLFVSALIPIAIAWLAYEAFGSRIMIAAFMVASLYYPYVDYAGYFLAEIYIMLLAPIVVALMLRAYRAATMRRVGSWGLFAGVVTSLAMSLKMVALPAFFGVAVFAIFFLRNRPLRARALVLVAMVAGAAPVSTLLTQRCTQATGSVCLGSNKAAADFLLGHYGRIQGIQWTDPSSGAVVSFGSPSAYQHGYRDVREVPFSITDREANTREALRWIREHPLAALALSAEHVVDTMGAALPWPSGANRFWMGAQLANYAFMLFMLLPSLVHLIDIARRKGARALLQHDATLLLTPTLGLIAAVAIATGEVRYRLPFDCLFMIVALRFFDGLRRRKRRYPKNPPAESVAA